MCGTDKGNEQSSNYRIAAGTTGWTTITLPPGRYELICNIAGHYGAGMYTALDVLADRSSLSGDKGPIVVDYNAVDIELKPAAPILSRLPKWNDVATSEGLHEVHQHFGCR